MKRGEKLQAVQMPDKFWEDWMLAVAGLKGEIDLLPETLKRWRREVLEFNLRFISGE